VGWRLCGRRGDLPKVPAFVESMGQQLAITVGQGGELPPCGIVREIETEKGRGLVVMGEGAWVEERKQELSRARPGFKWQELPVPEGFTVAFENEPDCLEWRRLAAKIAYERFASLRTSTVVKETGFDVVRRFILEGTEPRPVVGLIDDAAWIQEDGGLWVGVPRHAVAIAVTPGAGALHVVSAAVCLFGLYHFWVRLSPSFFTLAPFDDILVEHPQTGVVQNPALRYRLTVPRLPIDAWAARSAREPDRVREATKRYAHEKFHAALSASPHEEGS
jgi:hypothetical protein